MRNKKGHLKTNMGALITSDHVQSQLQIVKKGD